MTKKSIALNLILLIFAVLNCTICFAATITDKDFQKAVLEEIGKELKKAGFDEYNISVNSLPFTYLKVPDGKVEIKADTLEKRVLTSRMVIRTSIYVDNKYIKSVGVPITVATMENIFVANQKIDAGETITKDKLQLKKIDVMGKPKNFIRETDLNKGIVALKTFQPEEVITPRFVRIPPNVVKNSVIKVIINSKDSITITTEAIALSDGKIGETINVKNPKGDKIYSGKIIEDNKLYEYDTVKEDKQLKDAVHKIAMVHDINETSWDDVSKMKMQYVPGLIKKLGGIVEINSKITKCGMNFELERWKYIMSTGAYSASNVRSLLIKYAATL